MIIITGGAGFIGSAVVWQLNQNKVTDILIVDDIQSSQKWENLANLKYTDYVQKDAFIENLEGRQYDNQPISAIIHLGASERNESSMETLLENNTRYSQRIATYAIEEGVRFIYASTAETYGDGSETFSDRLNILEKLKPTHPAAYSKHRFDIWMNEKGWLKKSLGIKPFDVYGPNEYHKGENASIVYKAYKEIKKHGLCTLYKSNSHQYRDGEQLRDIVYIKDVAKIICWAIKNKRLAGMINIGCGVGHSWHDITSEIFIELYLSKKYLYQEIPSNQSKTFQNYTRANLNKIYNEGCPISLTPIRKAISEYVSDYLEKGEKHLDITPDAY